MSAAHVTTRPGGSHRDDDKPVDGSGAGLGRRELNRQCAGCRWLAVIAARAAVTGMPLAALAPPLAGFLRLAWISGIERAESAGIPAVRAGSAALTGRDTVRKASAQRLHSAGRHYEPAQDWLPIVSHTH